MKRKCLLFVCILICMTAGINAQTNWRRPASINDFLGFWSGDFSMDIPEFNSNLDCKIELDCNSASYEISLIFDFDKLLTNFSKMLEVSKDMLWGLLAEEFINNDDADGFKYSIKGYSVILSFSGSTGDLLEDNEVGETLINQNRTMMRLIFNEALSLGMGDEGISEIILNKR